MVERPGNEERQALLAAAIYGDLLAWVRIWRRYRTAGSQRVDERPEASMGQSPEQKKYR